MAPYIDDIVQGIYAAFSLAVAQTFYIAVGAAIIAAIAAAAMIEHPLRTSVGARPAHAGGQPVKAGLPISTRSSRSSTSRADALRPHAADGRERPAPQGRAFHVSSSRARRPGVEVV